ncbi:hypothetical protein HDU85_005633 [Gaertneriomyces sp. JEL0708]|nr:hypothetical protein HDU85_005633 [Gaertneriomyces sp. JEL0708]
MEKETLYYPYRRYVRSINVVFSVRDERRTPEVVHALEVLYPVIVSVPPLRELGLTLRIDDVSPYLQAAATAFLERLIRQVETPAVLHLKLAGISLLNSQIVGLGRRFGSVCADLHLTKCWDVGLPGVKNFLELAPKLTSLALYVPTITESLLGTIAESNHLLVDLWLDLPMDERPLFPLEDFADELSSLLTNAPHLRRLRLRGIPQSDEKASQALRALSQHSHNLRSLSILFWPPAEMGDGIDTVSFTHLNKLILSSNSKLSDDYIATVVRHCPSLAFLDVSRTKISDRTLALLPQHCPSLHHLDISRCALVSFASLIAIAQLGLTHVDISHSPKMFSAVDAGPFLLFALRNPQCQFLCEYPRGQLSWVDNHLGYWMSLFQTERGVLDLEAIVADWRTWCDSDTKRGASYVPMLMDPYWRWDEDTHTTNWIKSGLNQDGNVGDSSSAFTAYNVRRWMWHLGSRKQEHSVQGTMTAEHWNIIPEHIMGPDDYAAVDTDADVDDEVSAEGGVHVDGDEVTVVEDITVIDD